MKWLCCDFIRLPKRWQLDSEGSGGEGGKAGGECSGVGSRHAKGESLDKPEEEEAPREGDTVREKQDLVGTG